MLTDAIDRKSKLNTNFSANALWSGKLFSSLLRFVVSRVIGREIGTGSRKVFGSETRHFSGSIHHMRC